jgi:hypothetical protein
MYQPLPVRSTDDQLQCNAMHSMHHAMMIIIMQCCTDLGPARTWTWVSDLRSHRFGILGQLTLQVPDLQPNFMMYGSVKQV